MKKNKVPTSIVLPQWQVKMLLAWKTCSDRTVMNPQPFMSRTNPPRFSDTKVGDIFVCPDRFETDDKFGLVISECESLGTFHCMGQRQFAEKHSPVGFIHTYLLGKEDWAAILHGPYMERTIVYRASGDPSYAQDGTKLKWRKASGMAEADCRLRLQIHDVRIGRLQDITTAEALQAGVMPNWARDDLSGFIPEEHFFLPPGWVSGAYGIDAHDYCVLTAVECFEIYWDSIHGKTPGHAWADNPFVWIRDFGLAERLDVKK